MANTWSACPGGPEVPLQVLASLTQTALFDWSAVAPKSLFVSLQPLTYPALHRDPPACRSAVAPSSRLQYFQRLPGTLSMVVLCVAHACNVARSCLNFAFTGIAHDSRSAKVYRVRITGEIFTDFE